MMVAVFGRWTWAFLAFVGSVLATLAYASWRVRAWAWPMTLIVYGIWGARHHANARVSPHQPAAPTAFEFAPFSWADTSG
jgi:hypothetical protein